MCKVCTRQIRNALRTKVTQAARSKDGVHVEKAAGQKEGDH